MRRQLPVRAGEDANSGRPRGDFPARPGARLRAGEVRRPGGLLLHQGSHRREWRRDCLQPHAGAAVRYQRRSRHRRGERAAGIVPAPSRHGQRRAGTVDGQPSGRGHETSQPHPHLDRQRRRHDYARSGGRPVGAGGGGNCLSSWYAVRESGSIAVSSERLRENHGKKIRVSTHTSRRLPASPGRSSKRFARGCTRRVRMSRKR